ncbi:sugar-binding transcriptional regulator [Streptomyces sp. NPDC096311]|uniref:sugar-binding transcriptional regulator n=1 Tax=Streptomyces sp. NPDC096311 TaxID=3366083 RepID=UPI00381AA6F6
MRPAVSLEAAIVARRYYIDGMQKREIGDELGLSRFKVARLLDDALASGIVRIYVDMPADIDLPLGEELARAYGISRALVVRTVPSAPESTGSLIGTAGADYLRSILDGRDVLGMSWGASLTSVVNAVTELRPVDIVQMVGGVRAAGLDVSGSELVRRLTAKSGGRAFPLHAPLLVRSARTAAALRSDPSLSDTIARFADVTVALVGIGSWNPPRSSLHQEVTEPERAALRRAGAEADICGLVLDADGSPVESELNSRTIGITLEELRKVPTVLAVASGADKAGAIAAALRSSLVSVLVTDSDAAAALLDR